MSATALAKRDQTRVGDPTPERQRRMATKRMTLVEIAPNRYARKATTTADQVLQNGKMPMYLRTALDNICHDISRVIGAATLDHEPSTRKLIAGYDEPPCGTLPTSTSFSDRRLNSMQAVNRVMRAVPQEMMGVFDQLVKEEIAHSIEEVRTLRDFGGDIGYRDRASATAAGTTMVRDLCAVIYNAVRR